MSAGPAYRRLVADERREQILAAARRLYAEHPPSEVSSSAIAAEAGVTRGLLHHHFGTQRELYLEVVRSMVFVPPPPPPEELEGLPLEEVAHEAMDRWLMMVRRNRATWLASVGTGGGDPDVEAIFDEARDAAVDRMVSIITATGHTPSPRLWPAIRAFSAFSEAATVQWLRHKRLDRAETHELLTTTLLHLIATTEQERET